MGICASSPTTTRGARAGTTAGIGWPTTAKVIHVDGRLQEFKQQIKAGQIVSQNPNCFLCSLETMYLDSYVQQVPETEELQLGQIYFLMPPSQSLKPLSISDLCALAIKASTALGKHQLQADLNSRKKPSSSFSPFPGARDVKLPAGQSREGCKFPAEFNGALELEYKARRDNQGSY